MFCMNGQLFLCISLYLYANLCLFFYEWSVHVHVQKLPCRVFAYYYMIPDEGTSEAAGQPLE